MRPVLFIDIDGVLNDHRRMANGYARIDEDKATRLSKVLDELDADIVVHSAWRYLVLKESMTVRGFGDLLQSHGLSLYRPGSLHDMRILGVTRMDRGEGSTCDRSDQIREYAKEHGIKVYVAIDDLPLSLHKRRFVKTEGTVGLTDAKAEEIIRKIRSQEAP